MRRLVDSQGDQFRRLRRRLRRRGFPLGQINNHAQQLTPRGQFLLIDVECSFIRWVPMEQLIPTMAEAPCALFVLEVQR